MRDETGLNPGTTKESAEEFVPGVSACGDRLFNTSYLVGTSGGPGHSGARVTLAVGSRRPLPPTGRPLAAALALACLELSAAVAGYAQLIAESNVATNLWSHAGHFTPLSTGWYVGRSPRADREGVRELLPPMPDPLLRKVTPER